MESPLKISNKICHIFVLYSKNAANFEGIHWFFSSSISEKCIDNTTAKDVVNISGPKKDDCRWGWGGKITTILRRALFYFEQFFLEIAHRDLRRSVQKKIYLYL